jgi:glucose-6-phosphate 1-dehydrogenase
MTAKTPVILVIVGITGDLAARKLLPTIEAAAKAARLPDDFHLIGTTRQSDITVDDLRGETGPYVREHLEFFQMDVKDISSYQRLAEHLLAIEQTLGAPAQRLFYLSVPPEASAAIIEKLGTSGLAQVPQTKLLMEKPFGVDLASATELGTRIERYFKPEQIYRIDHYLAKEVSQSLLGTWNTDSLERIVIRAEEKVGIEGRVDFYEQTGALRDVVQNHLLELTALVCMPPARENSEEIPLRRLEALKNLYIPTDKPLATYVRRGQYEGYREEVGNTKSVVETYVSLTLHSRDPRLAGVPITLITGKNLGAKTTEVRITYKKGNELVFAEKPGRDAYEKVLLDAIDSKRETFVSGDEVEESWRIIAPVQEAWKKSDADLFIYKAGAVPEPVTP